MTKQVIFEEDYVQPEHEIIIKYKTDDFDWIDPLKEVYIEGGVLFVDNGRGVYEYILSEIEDYKIREYSSEDIFDYKGGNL